jgi:two-component system OmpR family response regulator
MATDTTPKTIVIVDDEPHIVDMLSTFLTIKGFTPRGAYTGQDGLIMVGLEKPAALLLDLMLPDIDGFEVCRQLRGNPAHEKLPILIISARTDPEAQQLAAKAGADAYFTKPVRFPELMVELNRLWALRGSDASAGHTASPAGHTASPAGHTASPTGPAPVPPDAPSVPPDAPSPPDPANISRP